MTRLPPHRNLFTTDSTTFFLDPHRWHPEGTPHTAKAIHRFVDTLAGNGVDTVLINPTTQVAWYPSRAVPTILDGYTRNGFAFLRGHLTAEASYQYDLDGALQGLATLMNRYLDLAEAGVDWLAEATKACRRHGVSPWASIRMNDTHGCGNPEESFFNCPLFKQHPEYRLAMATIDGLRHADPHHCGLNYTLEPVRDYMFALIRDVVENYDIAGLELDWLRDPICCPPPASQTEADALTEWVAEIRALADRKAAVVGRPFHLGMRISPYLEMMRAIGLDVRAMVRRGLLDFISPSNSWQTSWDVPYDQLRSELGRDVAIYGVIEDAPNWVTAHAPEIHPHGTVYDGIRYLSGSAALVRGNAAGKLVFDIDGIETFNYFCTDEPKAPGLTSQYGALKHLYDLERLRGQAKHYALTTVPAYRELCWRPPFDTVDPLPAVLEPAWRRAFRLAMCAEPADHGLELVVQVLVEKTERLPRLGVSFNGSFPTFETESTDAFLLPVGPYIRVQPYHQAYNIHFPASAIKEGWNEIIVYNGSPERSTPEARRDHAFTVVGIELAVKPTED